jgi:plasmid stability protein
MNAITIRSISAETAARIEELASMHHRTVEEEAAAILVNAVAAPLGPRERYLLAERVAAIEPLRGARVDDRYRSRPSGLRLRLSRRQRRPAGDSVHAAC